METECAAGVNTSTAATWRKFWDQAKSSLPSSSSPSKTTSKVARRRRLNLLPKMPLDVLFEIFSHLGPRDLVSLTRTSKAFRETLLSANAKSVWKAVRAQHDAPEPLGEMAEVHWTELLFGHACQGCGAKNIPNVDFFIRRRYCKVCKRKNIILESKLKRHFGVPVDAEILDLVPYTNESGWCERRKGRYFLISEVELMMKEVARLEEDVRAGRPNAVKNLRTFKDEHRKLAQRVMENAPKCIDWHRQYTLGRRVEKPDRQTLIAQRRDAIFDRLRQLGYEDTDIMYAGLNWLPDVAQPTPLTDRIWQRIRQGLEESIQESKAAREEAAREAVLNPRRRVVNKLYHEFQRTISPHQWKYLPRAEEIFEQAPISHLINAPLDSEVKEEDFRLAMTELPSLLAAHSDEACQKYFRLMFDARTDTLSTEVASPSTESSSDSQSVTQIRKKLDRATSVFSCKQSSWTAFDHGSPAVLIGVDDLLTHHCDREEWADMTKCNQYTRPNPASSSLMFSPKGAAEAGVLVKLAGLDPDAASAGEMDTRDARFVCRTGLNNAEQDPGDDLCHLRVYSWRTAIQHSLSSSHECEWICLPEDDAEHAKRKERQKAESMAEEERWTCGHCLEFMPRLRARRAVCWHLKKRHAIEDPQEPADLFYFERYKRSSHSPGVTIALPRSTVG